MIKFLKLVARGKKALVPKPMFSREASSSSGTDVRSHSRSVGASFTRSIPNRSVTIVKDKYTPPPKRVPFAVIPDGVCKGCE